MLFQQVITILPFKRWLWKDRENKRLLWFFLAVILASFTWLKIIYPYPNFISPESYSYLDAAYTNQFINIWPIGYSKFLRLVSVFSRSHMVLVALQYLLLQASVLYFLLTIRHLLSPGKWLFRVLLGVSILNPLLPHIANIVSGDCLFTTLSLVWFTQLLWIIYQPTLRLIFIHAVVLLLVFMVRFNAGYYPFISAVIIVFSGMRPIMKRLGIGAIALLLLTFIGRTQYEYQIKTGATQYAAFGGWLMAANALQGYAYTQRDDRMPLPLKFVELHLLVKRHIDSLRRLSKRPDEEIGVYYLSSNQSPLWVYMKQEWQKDTTRTYFKQWASMGPLYHAYGWHLISNYPGPFIRYYIWPNLIRYYAPPAHFMENYNMGNKTADSVGVAWFDWKNNQLPVNSTNRKIHIVRFFPTILAIINPLFLLSSLYLALAGFSKCNGISKRIIACTLMVWFCNTFFSICSAPVELRQQLFPVIITLPFAVLFISWIMQPGLSISATGKKTVPFPDPAV